MAQRSYGCCSKKEAEMPCYLVVAVEITDYLAAKRAADELGLVEGRDYTLSSGQILLKNPSKAGAMKQRYGLLQAESQARRKGYRSQRKVQEDGAVQLQIWR